MGELGSRKILHPNLVFHSHHVLWNGDDAALQTIAGLSWKSFPRKPEFIPVTHVAVDGIGIKQQAGRSHAKEIALWFRLRQAAFQTSPVRWNNEAARTRNYTAAGLKSCFRFKLAGAFGDLEFRTTGRSVSTGTMYNRTH